MGAIVPLAAKNFVKSFGNGAAPRLLMISDESGADARSSSAQIILV